MEARGAVNQYMPYYRKQMADGSPAGPVFTVNLAAGVTPFVRHFNGIEYTSQCYRITAQPITVTHGNYRPGPERFKTLDEFAQDHVLNGGLLCEELAVAQNRQIPNDPVEHTWESEQFQAWCLEIYGRRRQTLERPR